MTRVAVATCAELPDLHDDGPALLAALAAAGVQAAPAVWDDPAVDWDAYDAVLVHSTWDYTWRREEFLAWAGRVPRVLNPLPVLTWNTDKRYLLDLAAAGVPVVPTTVLDPGQPFAHPYDGDVVVKPAVSAGSRDTGRFPAGDPRAAALAARLLGAGRSVVVQPYQPAVEERGETALLHLGGAFSHAARKAPLLPGHGERAPLTEQDHEESITAATADRAQRAVAEQALRAVPGEVAYARVDLVPGPDGPLVLELELTEPSLFLEHAAPEGVARLAAAVARAARG